MTLYSAVLLGWLRVQTGRMREWTKGRERVSVRGGKRELQSELWYEIK